MNSVDLTMIGKRLDKLVDTYVLTKPYYYCQDGAFIDWGDTLKENDMHLPKVENVDYLLDIEQCYLGGVLLAQEYHWVEHLAPFDFGVYLHSVIFHAIKHQLTKDEDFSMDSLVNHVLHECPKIEKQELVNYLRKLIDNVCSNTMLPACIEIIRCFSVKRQLEEIKEELAELNE